MSKNKIALILGLWIILISFLGFPRSWENIMYIVSGVLVASLALFGNERRRSIVPRRKKEVVTDMFVEHTMPSKNEREPKEPLS